MTVSSGGMYTQALDLDDLQSARDPYRGATVYARTKRAQVVLTEEWTRRLAGRGITAHAMHPGWVDTPGIEASLPGFHRVLGPLLRTPAQGADTIVWLGAAEEPLRRPGRFWHDRRERPVTRLPGTGTTPEDALRLWEACERLARQTLDGRPRRGLALGPVDGRDDGARVGDPDEPELAVVGARRCRSRWCRRGGSCPEGLVRVDVLHPVMRVCCMRLERIPCRMYSRCVLTT